MTPREQLIEAITEGMIAVPRPQPYFDGSNERPVTDLAEAALQALSDLGLVVLMAVKPGESVANVIVLDEKHVLRTTQEERNEGVYVNALESEQ